MPSSQVVTANRLKTKGLAFGTHSAVFPLFPLQVEFVRGYVSTKGARVEWRLISTAAERRPRHCTLRPGAARLSRGLADRNEKCSKAFAKSSVARIAQSPSVGWSGVTR